MHIPRKRFGQHFLRDQRIIHQIINFFDPQNGQNILEIGPGTGALTNKLLQKIACLYAVEVDRNLSAQLRQNWSAEQLILFNEDILNFDLAKLPHPLRIIGNLPYNISTPLLFHLLNQINYIQDMYFMFQFEVAERLCAQPGDAAYGRLSIMAQYFCSINIDLEIPNSAFTPPPQVNSAMVYLRPRAQPEFCADLNLFKDVVRQAFTQRRKTIQNALKNFTEIDWTQLNLDPKLRPEQLSGKNYLTITNFLAQKNN